MAVCALLATPSFVLADCKTPREFKTVVSARPDATQGEKLFAACVACHRGDGGGQRDGNVPIIAAQHFRVIARQLVDFRNAARWDIRMERVADRHHLTTTQAIADVARFVADLPPVVETGIGNGYELQRGVNVYRAQCASCHGAQGEGNDTRSIPRLAGQHQLYVMRQLQDAADERRPNLRCAHGAIGRNLRFEEIQGVADYLSRLAKH